MSPPRRAGYGALFAPVVIERAGGGLSRVADDPAPLQVLRGLAREGAEILGAERTSIWRMGPAGMPLRCLTRFHRSSGTHEDDLAYPDELGRETWRLLERLSVLAMDDVRSAPAPAPVFGNYLQEGQIRAILAVPIRYRGSLAGYLSFEETRGPRAWTPRDRTQAATLAFRLERHWGRMGTSVGTGRLGAPAPPAAAEAPPPRLDTNPGSSPPFLPGDPPGSGSENGTAPEPIGLAEFVDSAVTSGPGVDASTPAAEPEVSPTRAPEPGETPGNPGIRVPGTPTDPSAARPENPEPRLASVTTGSFGHRRELRARLQRLRTLERTGILGTRTAREALHWLDVQEGTLALLEAHLPRDGAALGFLEDAREALDRARDELVRHLGWARQGLGSPGPLEMNALVGGLAVRLGKLTGDRVGLVFAPSSEPVRVVGDPVLLERCLEELVRNARNASVAGERVRIRIQRADLAGGRRAARLVVEDQGVGISPANLPWIFEPWFSTRGDGADGYGLPYVQAVIEGHGGWVDVTSTEGRGSLFTVNLPLLDPLASEAEAGEEEEATRLQGPESTPARPLVLVVEDEPLTARLLRHALEGAGFRVLVSGGGPEALRLVRDHAPSAALLVAERVLDDGMEGMELLRTGRSLQPYLGGILFDRRLRAGGDADLLVRIREAGGIPSDVALVPAPLHPASLVAEARRIASKVPAADEASRGGDSTLH